MAWLKRRGKVWYLYWTEGGRQRARRVSRDRRIAQERLRRFEEDRDRAAAGVQRADPWLSEAVESYRARLRARVAAGDLAPSTERRATDSLDYFLTWLEAAHADIRRLGEVSQGILAAYQLHRAEQVRAATVNVELLLIGGLFKQAIREGRLVRDPSSGIRALKERDSRPAHKLTTSQIADLLRAARKVDPELEAYLMGLTYLGCRRGELFGLTWEDMDLQGGIARVPNFKTSRSVADSHRAVPIHPELARVLRRRRSLERPWPPIPNQTLRRRFLQVTARAGMPWLTRLHDLRHGFAVSLLSRGVPLFTVGTLLGHRDPRTTMRYSGLAPQHLKRAVGLLRFQRGRK